MALGFIFLMITVRGMENNQAFSSIIPLAIKTEAFKRSFITSRAIITVDCLKKEMEIKYNTSTFILPSTNLFCNKIGSLLEKLPTINNKFYESYEHKGVLLYYKKYFKVCTASFSDIYRIIEQLTAEHLK